MIPRNFEARRFGDEHQAGFLAKWTGGIVYTTIPLHRAVRPGVRISPRELAEGSKVVAEIGDWIIRRADGQTRVEPAGNQDGYCADCGEPVWWHDARLVTRVGSRWCYGRDRSRIGMTHWHALPGMDQYVAPAAEGEVCQCLDRPWPHVHQIIPAPPQSSWQPLPGWHDSALQADAAGTCGECTDGLVAAGVRCSCDPGPEGQHQPLCGFIPCLNGCWERLHPPVSFPDPNPRGSAF